MFLARICNSPLLGIRQFAVTYGKLPLRDGKLLSRVAAALAWQGALSSSPFLILIKRSFINQYHCNPTRVVVIGELPCVTNTNQWLNIQLTIEQLGF